MIEIDCNKCANCDKENDRCKIYGRDPKAAVETCASKYFGAYRPNWRPKPDGGSNEKADGMPKVQA